MGVGKKGGGEEGANRAVRIRGLLQRERATKTGSEGRRGGVSEGRREKKSIYLG